MVAFTDHGTITENSHGLLPYGGGTTLSSEILESALDVSRFVAPVGDGIHRPFLYLQGDLPPDNMPVFWASERVDSGATQQDLLSFVQLPLSRRDTPLLLLIFLPRTGDAYMWASASNPGLR